MAITEKTNPTQSFVEPYRTVAALGSMVLGLAIIVGMIYTMILGAAPDDGALLVILTLLGTLAATAGAVLRFGTASARKQSLWILLVFWVLVALAGALQMFASLLWDGWSLLGSENVQWSWILMSGELLFGGVMVVLLFRATPAQTRDRYGANVTVSVGVVVAVVVVLNMLSFATPLEHDFEMLGRFGLSERSKRILREVDQPMTISAIYTDARMNVDSEVDRQTRNEARKRLDRVMELLKEIQRYNPNIKVQDASGDVARARLMNELRTIQKGKTGEHETLLRAVRKEIPTILNELDALQKQWSNLPSESYLAQWDVGGTLANGLGEQAEKIEALDRDIAQTLATTPLPDYVKLLNDLTGELRSCQELLDTESELLQQLGSLPATIRANAPKVRQSVETCIQAVRSLRKVVDRGGEDGSEDPEAVLKEFSGAIGKARQRVLDASKALKQIAGEDDEQANRLVSVSRAWQIEMPSGVMGMRIRTTRSRLFDALAKDLESLRAQAAIQLSDANEQAQRRFLVEMRKPVGQLMDLMKRNQSAVEQGIEQLTSLDAASRAILAQAKAGKLFASVRTTLAPLLAKADALEPPKEDALPPDLSGKNILVLQTGDKVEVVTYDKTWPQRAGSGPMGLDDQESDRYFHGDAALASRILGITRSRPFGRVLMTYLEPELPPQMRMRIRLPQGDIPPSQLTEFRQRLKDANFQVQDWNLAQEMPAEAKDEESNANTQPSTQPAESREPIPTILVVLPPAPAMPPMGPGQPPMPSFGPEHVRKLRDAIDDGASAMFLACNLQPRMMGYMPMPQQYALDEYLQKDWGLDAKTSYMLVEGIASETPGKYQINLVKTQFMPLSTFTAQAIGKPLQGRRMIWLASCPVTTAGQLPKGVSVASILTVPETMTNVWAVADLQRLAREIGRKQKGLTRPQYDRGDMKVPFSLAMAATREGDLAKGIAPSRAVVFGVGMSFVDAFITQPIPLLTSQGGYEPVPPPSGNLDLAVNAAYWLIGKESYIAAGPTSVEPVRAMDRSTQNTIWVVCVLGLPIVTILAGMMVLARRRLS